MDLTEAEVVALVAAANAMKPPELKPLAEVIARRQAIMQAARMPWTREESSVR